MLCRAKSPNAGLWNGLGGKIHGDETPLACVQREMEEEAGIRLDDASSFIFAGISTWRHNQGPIKGMYVYIAHLSPRQAEQVRERATPEGLIAWKSLSWVCDTQNKAVVDNIPLFLLLMLEPEAAPCEYLCDYREDDNQDEYVVQLVVRTLPPEVVLEECLPDRVFEGL